MSAAAHQDEEPSLVNISLPVQSVPRPSEKMFHSLDAPFHMLPAEFVVNRAEFSTRADGDDFNGTETIRTIVVLSNYRFFVQFVKIADKKRPNAFGPRGRPSMAFYNILLRCIESVEMREIFYLCVLCKDGRVAKIAFDNNENGVYWFRLISDATQPLKNVHDLFAFSFYAKCQIGTSERNGAAEPSSDAENEENFVKAEFERMNFDEKHWRITSVNSCDFKVCPTYPAFWIVPSKVTDEELKKASQHRSLRRVAAVVWRHKENGAVLIRSSQPESGIFGWRSPSDENLLQCIAEASKSNAPVDETPRIAKPLLILDARSYTAAWANRAKGGGFENKDNYQNCEIQFLGLANIHAIRNSFQKLRAILWDTNGYPSSGAGNQPGDYSGNGWAWEASFFQNLDACQWPLHLWALLNSSARVVEALHVQGRCVLVHCSDGWDRTTQIVALAKLMLDPFYRTLNGFKELIEREWISFGHKFAERGGLMPAGDPTQRAPVFLQWLDCVRYLLREYPSSFEFNEIYLVKLAQHTFSGLFGTFSCNSARELRANRIAARTFSIWTYLNHPDRRSFVNLLYAPHPLHHRRFFGQIGAADCDIAASEMPPAHLPNEKRCERSQEGPPLPTYAMTRNEAFSRSRAVLNAQILAPRVQVRDLAQIWRQVYCPPDDPANWRPLRGLSGATASMLRLSASSLHLDEALALGAKNLEGSQQPMHRTHSCDDLLTTSICGPEIFTVRMRQNDTKIAPRLLSGQLQRSSSESTLHDALLAATVDVGAFPTHSSTPYAAPDTSEALGEKSGAVFFTKKLHVDEALTSNDETAAMKSNDGRVDLLFDVPSLDVNVGRDSAAKVHITQMADGSLQPTINSIAVETRAADKICRDSSEAEKLSTNRKIVFDIDGLQTVVDPVQQRIRQILLDYEKRLEYGQTEIDRLKASLLSMEQMDSRMTEANAKNGSVDSELMDGNFEPSSIDSRASENSFDALVDFRNEKNTDDRPTLWMPDHAVTKCSDCNANFWAIKRRHHCRNCGKIFCAQCTNYECPVPQEQFFKPVRVCYRCYEHLISQQASDY